LRATRTINKKSPRMVKRRNSRYKAFDWEAPRRVPIDCTPVPAEPMVVAPLGRTRKRRMWRPSNPDGLFAL